MLVWNVIRQKNTFLDKNSVDFLKKVYYSIDWNITKKCFFVK